MITVGGGLVFSEVGSQDFFFSALIFQGPLTFPLITNFMELRVISCTSHTLWCSLSFIFWSLGSAVSFYAFWPLERFIKIPNEELKGFESPTS